MLKAPTPFRLRSMRLSDIVAVMEIEKVAFATPWKASAYRYEVTQNRLANYQVLTVRPGDHPARLIGYSGYWLMADEAHISTIAVHPTWRGRGLGELLLLNMLFLAYQESAQMVTLEVRASNAAAQALYRKYDFVVVGERRRYYTNNGEDALIMTLEPLDKAYHQKLRQKREQLFKRLRDLHARGAPR